MGEGKRETAIYTAFEDFEPTDVAVPERNLLRAVLMAALNDAKNKNGEARGKAMQYLLSAEDDYLFSFRSICDYLNVDAEKILLVSGLSGSEGRGAKVAQDDQEQTETQR